MSESKEIVEFAFDKMEQYLGAVKDIISEYGGDVAELGLNALRVDALSQILLPFFFMLISIVWVRLNIKFVKHIKHKFSSTDRDIFEYGLTPWAIISSIFNGVALFISLYELANIWAWVGIFYPELYAVHKFILN